MGCPTYSIGVDRDTTIGDYATFDSAPGTVGFDQVAVRALYRVGFLDSEEYFDRFWFWDEAGLPPTRVGGLQRDQGSSFERARCTTRCAAGSQATKWQDAVRGP